MGPGGVHSLFLIFRSWNTVLNSAKKREPNRSLRRLTNRAFNRGVVMDEHAEVVEVELGPREGMDHKAQLRAIGGGIALVAALLIGALLATSDDPQSLDVTATQDDQSDSEDTADRTDESDAEPVVDNTSDETDRDLPANEGSDDSTEASAGDGFGEFAAQDSAYYGGPDGVIFDGSRFISIGYSESGPTLRTSNDGIIWAESPFAALPSNSNVYQLAEHDGMVIAVVEQWNDEGFDEDSPEAYLGPAEGPTHYLASSTNLETWTLTELPAPSADDGPVFLSVNGVVLNDAGVVLFTQAHREGGNQMRMLFDAGIIDTEDLDRYCGIDFADGDVYKVQLCNFEDDGSMWEEFEAAMDAATTDEERREIEIQFEENFVEPVPEVIATISPGDPLHDELHAIFTDQGSEPTTTILSGPVDGPFTQTELDFEGYPSGLVEVDGTFVTILQQWNRGETPTTTVLRSNDGQSWDEVGSLPEGDVGRLVAVGPNLLVLGGDDEGQPLSLLSTDLGASWTNADIITNLFGVYPEAAVGPAGVAVIMRGATEPYPAWTPPLPTEIERDGFVMTITYGDEDGLVTLHDADGNLIYSLKEYEMYETGSDGVVRVSRLTGMPTFLDPETGEDLVSFTQDDYEAAYRVFEDEPAEEIGFAIEILFSMDAIAFAPLNDPRLDIDTTRGNIQLVGVGDDEVIFAKHTWVEPPNTLFAFEEEGREPTEAEEQALDAWFSTNGGENAIEYIRVEIG